MISTRIIRGAVRTHVLIRESLQNNSVAVNRSVLTVRSFLLSFVALRMVLPIPVLADGTVDAQIDSLVEAEPPSMVRLDQSSLKTIIQIRTDDLSKAVETPHFTTIKAGKSAATIRAEERAKKEEADRKAAIAKARAKAAQEAARRRTRTLALVPVSSGSAQDLVKKATISAFGEAHWPAMASLVMRESGFNPNSYNTRSGACGLFQALPCSKMGGMEINNQVSWGIRYIRSRYQNPTNAWQHWLVHHWY